MLKILAYIEDRGGFEYIAASESGRLATRVQNPFAQIPEVQDLERVLKAKLEAADPKPEGLPELVEQIRQFNDTVSSYERVRYLKTITPELAKAIEIARTQCDTRAVRNAQQSQHTILNMDLKVVKVEKDGE